MAYYFDKMSLWGWLSVLFELELRFYPFSLSLELTITVPTSSSEIPLRPMFEKTSVEVLRKWFSFCSWSVSIYWLSICTSKCLISPESWAFLASNMSFYAASDRKSWFCFSNNYVEISFNLMLSIDLRERTYSLSLRHSILSSSFSLTSYFSWDSK